MNELMIALTKLAEAGIKYLEAKTENERKKGSSETFKVITGAQAGQVLVDAITGMKAGPLAAEVPTQKKARRTKEQITADEAAAQTRASEEAAAKITGPAHAEPAAGPAALLSAAQPPAPAAAAPNPLGDFGPVAAALTLPQQIAKAQEQTAAVQQQAPAAQPPAAAAAPKVMTEEESKVNLARSVAVYVKVTAGAGATEEKLDAARNVFRSYMTTTLKAAKVKDLTHDQRIAAIAWLEAETSKAGK